jgi:hypothetical protein
VTSPALKPVRDKWSGLLLSGIFLVIAVLVFLGIYLSLPGQQHYWALIAIGIVALILALGCYLMESISRDPTAQRSLAWGFFGMGFAVLLLTVGLGPTYGLTSTVAMVWGLVAILAVLLITVGLIAWRSRALRATENQQVARAAWRNESAPSAFSYAAANSPSVPQTAPPPPPPAGGSPPPRSP